MDTNKLLTYARGWQLDEKEVLEALERWEEAALPLMWSRELFYCYDCGFPKYVSEKMLRHGQQPRCPICKKRMSIYDAHRLRRWRKELADKIRAALSRGLLRIFSEAAEKCGGIKRWALLTNGVLEVDSTCAKFWYDPRHPVRQSIDAVLYGDVPEVEKTLRRAVYELNVWLFYTVKK